MQIAQTLDLAGIDIVELASTADDEQRRSESSEIACSLVNARACCVSQISDDHIEIARKILNGAEQPRIHLYLDAKRVHGMTKSKQAGIDATEAVSSAVTAARKFFPEVQFSPQDATRCDQNSLLTLITAAVNAGANIINISDTTGTATPDLITKLFAGLRESVCGIDQSVLALHAHNHEGRASDNVMTAIDCGIRQVEGTIHGVGPAGGNTNLIDVLQRLETNPPQQNLRFNADLDRLQELARHPCFHY